MRISDWSSDVCSSDLLVEEFIVVALVCALLLWHARSALVAILTLPLGVLAALIVMRLQGLNANIMSLGGIAIAVGAMVDAAIVMIENAHKRSEEHTSELQSLIRISYTAFRLKKKNLHIHNIY